MIVTTIDPSVALYRAHTPQWASQPLSGAGAAKKGGRLNRPGVHALYLSLTTEGAIAEYTQDEPLMPPCTLVAYRAQLSSVVDFGSGYDPASWDPLWQELTCNWRGTLMLDGIEPPSWSLADMAIVAGHCGIRYPAQRACGLNLVVYTDAVRPPDYVAAHDPGERLPRDRSSWEELSS
jgi:RES domain-containing protein